MQPQGQNPERLLSAALRAQAVGGQSPSPSPGPAPASPPPARRKLPVVSVLIFAVVLGFAAGALAGVLSTL
ncbi:hypothetical protein [Saccharopolyspora taberi]|uniref:Uncharacterized protein n=1 Tax=Saccharopolyspora taberi TaxID=60895 RepID=A0ABN3VKZ3_9PSEU